MFIPVAVKYGFPINHNIFSIYLYRRWAIENQIDEILDAFVTLQERLKQINLYRRGAAVDVQ